MKRKTVGNVSVLVVDDSAETTELIRRNLETGNYHVYTANSVASAIKLLGSIEVHLVITDLKMPGQNGTELIRHISENCRGISTLVITGFPTIQGAVESIKFGAEEYLVKPFTDDELFRAVEKSMMKTKRSEKNSLTNTPAQNFGIIGQSPAILKVFSTIRKARSTNATVLITGESGTGKELVARALHYGGQTTGAPFVAVNCGGIPDSLLESELFGHVKGAFTGATDTRAGFFQTADGGSIFLDEISNTSLAMQAKLLRVLQEKEFYMVGSKKPNKVNVRVIAASNVDLPQMVQKGLFREDLYYRLNILTIHLPPLRERENDVLQLAEFFLARYVKELGRSPMKFSPKALRALQDYGWPGNVRELQNLVHRLVILADDDVIDVPDLPDNFRYNAGRSRSLQRSLQEVEREYISEVLAANQNNISRTAAVLGIDRKTLREKIRAKRK